MNKFLLLLLLKSTLFTVNFAHAQNLKNMPVLPKGGTGFQGSAGAGFVDFKTLSPVQDFKLERGVYMAAQLERGFNVLNLYLTFGISHLNGEGIANYNYANLSSSTTYSLDDVPFRVAMYEAGLGLKMKLIDDYWFRPYVEGGGIGSYNEVTYGTRITTLNATGSDYKRKDVIMGSGYYGEAGVEIAFNERFGVKLAARQNIMQTKKLETLGNRPVRLQNEIYYLSALFGF